MPQSSQLKNESQYVTDNR